VVRAPTAQEYSPFLPIIVAAVIVEQSGGVKTLLAVMRSLVSLELHTRCNLSTERFQDLGASGSAKPA
jgi:hypothetical protein